MGILIKGMDMPKNCGCCCLRFAKWCEARIYMETRPVRCPLVDVPMPHVRLIDADAIDGLLSDGEIKARQEHRYVMASAINTMQGNLRKMPTVIEAEE